MDFLTAIIVITMMAFSVWKKLNEQRKEDRERKKTSLQRFVVQHENPDKNQKDFVRTSHKERGIYQAGSNQIKKENKNDTNNCKIEVYKKENEWMKSSGEARRAFVYSEIFRRKYY